MLLEILFTLHQQRLHLPFNGHLRRLQEDQTEAQLLWMDTKSSGTLVIAKVRLWIGLQSTTRAFCLKKSFKVNILPSRLEQSTEFVFSLSTQSVMELHQKHSKLCLLLYLTHPPSQQRLPQVVQRLLSNGPSRLILTVERQFSTTQYCGTMEYWAILKFWQKRLPIS